MLLAMQQNGSFLLMSPQACKDKCIATLFSENMAEVHILHAVQSIR